MKIHLVRWQANFYTGLVLVLPATISIVILLWLFGGVANITDKPLVFLRFFLHPEQLYTKSGQMHWWWRIFGLLLAILLLSGIGALTRYYLGKRLIALIHTIFLRIPLLNKIYVAIKQVNDAFTSEKKSSFKQVVLVEFPKAGLYSIGFLTGEDHPEAQAKLGQKVLSVFVPTTPNPTTGFLILLPERDVIRLDMSVADGIKYIVSLGSVAPPCPPQLLDPGPNLHTPTLPPPAPEQLSAQG